MTGLHVIGASGHSIGASGRWVLVCRCVRTRRGRGASGQVACVSGHDLGVALSQLTLEIVQISLNAGDTWTTINDRTLGLVHPVDMTGVFGRSELSYSESLTALF